MLIDQNAPTEERPPSVPSPEIGSQLGEWSGRKPRPGQWLDNGRYKLRTRLGKGTMGEVFQAEDAKLKKFVALKFRLQSEGVSPREDRRSRELVLAEARKAQDVTHPSVCRVYDVRTDQGTDFISMEFVEGKNLRSLLRQSVRMPACRVIQLVIEICAGLTAIHGCGLIHQDLKPANIMVDRRWHAKIMDLGLADSRLLGWTRQFAAPEQLNREGISVQSDLFSLGALIYEMIAGIPAFQKDCFVDPAPRLLGEMRKGIGEGIEKVVISCLEKEPTRRPDSAASVGKVFEAALRRRNSLEKIQKPWLLVRSVLSGLL